MFYQQFKNFHTYMQNANASFSKTISYTYDNIGFMYFTIWLLVYKIKIHFVIIANLLYIEFHGINFIKE